MLSVSELPSFELEEERQGGFRLLARVAFVLMVIVALLQPGAPSLAQTGGAVPSSDATLLVKVRQAGLWEMPSGIMAMQKGTTQTVKDVGFALMVDHGRLDKMTRDLAQTLGVALPEQPSDEQRGWLGEEMNATGKNFDRIFANRLRAAHGAVYLVLAQLRSGTRNDQVRAFATTGNQAVTRHMTLLESTGLVDYDSLPEPVVSATAAPAGQPLGLDPSQIAVVAALFVVVGGGLFYVLRQIKSNRGRTRVTARPATVRTGGGRG